MLFQHLTKPLTVGLECRAEGETFFDINEGDEIDKPARGDKKALFLLRWSTGIFARLH